MTTELEVGPGGTKMTIAGIEMLMEGGTKQRREGDRDITHKGVNVNPNKSNKTDLPSKLEV